MTVSSTTLRNDHVGNGSQVEFPLTIETLTEINQVGASVSTVKVIVTSIAGVESVKIEDVDYTVALDEDTRQGNITFTVAPALNELITFLSNISFTQVTDYINLGTDKFPAKSHEGTVDKLTLISQQLEETINRAILLSESSSLTGVTIPISVANADKAIVVNTAGDNLDAKDLADIGAAPVSAFGKLIIDLANADAARVLFESQKDVITTRGDLVVGDATNVASRLALGTSNNILLSDGTDAVWANALQEEVRPILTVNVIDPSNDIDFSAGFVRKGSQFWQPTALTKQLDAVWAQGDNQGGLFSGVKANNTWYHCFTINAPSISTADFGFDTDINAANRPAIYTDFKLIESFLTDGSGNIIDFIHTGNSIDFKLNIFDVNQAFTTTRTNHPISTPLDRKVRARVLVDAESGSLITVLGLINSPLSTDVAVTASNNNILTEDTANSRERTTAEFSILTNTSSQISSRFNSTSGTLEVKTFGWEDSSL